MKFIKKIISYIQKTVLYLENDNSSLLSLLLTFIFAITLRNAIEAYSTRIGILSAPFLHYYMFYISIALSITLLFYLITKESIKKLLKVILPSFIILILAPSIDLILSKGTIYKITYLLPNVHTDLFSRFLTFFGNFEKVELMHGNPIYAGVTPGIQIELALVLFFSFLYIYIKTSNILRSMVGTISLYSLIFIYFILPFILKFIANVIGVSYAYSPILFIKAYFILSFITGVLILYILHKKIIFEIIKDIRPLRLSHYELMFTIGILYGLSTTNFNLHLTQVFSLILMPISIIFAWIFSVMTNNISDINIDKISNKKRPLIVGSIEPILYTNISWWFLILATLFAVPTGFSNLFIIILFIGNYFLYSMPPLRIKRILILSKTIIAINSIALMLSGFTLITNKSIISFPWQVIILLFIGITLTSNFIDIKDYYGDKAEKITTLPVLLGLKNAKLLISFFFLFFYMSVLLFIEKSIKNIIFITLLAFAQFYFVNKKDYKEWYVFSLHIFTLIICCIYLILKLNN